MLDWKPRLRVSAPPLVEITHRKHTEGQFEWVGLYNHSGQRDQFVGEPIVRRDVKLQLRAAQRPRTVRLLRSGEDLAFESDPTGTVQVTVPELGQYEVVLVGYK